VIGLPAGGGGGEGSSSLLKKRTKKLLIVEVCVAFNAYLNEPKFLLLFSKRSAFLLPFGEPQCWLV
jgi:hypothetical protein